MSEFPSEIDRYDLRDSWVRFERASNFPDFRRSFFGEGPHLTSSAELPWGDEVRHLVKEAYLRFLHGANWLTGKGLFEMQDHVIGWMGGLLGASAPAGVITTGGTESNLVALLTAKQLAGRAGSVVFPSYAHYSFLKACGMFGLTPIVVEPREPRGLVAVDDLRDAMREDTIALVGTAGTWPFGAIDDIQGMGALAEERGVYLHVDSCLGGYVIPFLERAGYHEDLAPWDFRVAGVCSVSADLHKHGMVPPPASSIMFRDESFLAAARQICPPHGTMTGTRGGGPIAAAWTMVSLLGLEGYCAVALKCMSLRDQLIEGLLTLPGVAIYEGSKINIFTVFSEQFDLHPVWTGLRKRGWMISNRNDPAPSAIVLWTLPQNDGMIEEFLNDFRTGFTDAPPVTEASFERAQGRAEVFDAYGDIFTEDGDGD